MIILTSIFLSLSITGGYALYFQHHRYPLKIENISYDKEDQHKIGALNQLQVMLRNEGGKPIVPKFWIRHENLIQRTAYWDIIKGPVPLTPSSQANYLIGTEIPEEMIFNHAPVTLEVNDDKSYTIKTFLRNFEVQITPAPILNPKFRYWSGLFEKLPFRWHLVKDVAGGDNANLYPERVQRRDGITLEVYQDGETREKEWAKIFLGQFIEFPSFDIKVWVYPTFKYRGGKDPLYLYGVEVQGNSHAIWYIFSEIEEAVHVLSPTQALILRHAPLHQWTVHRINIQEDFTFLNWESPDYLSFRYFLSVHTTLPGHFKGHFGEIQF